MKPLTQKVLESGLVDRHMAEMLEKWGNLPEGSADIVKDGALENATREQLTKLAEELGDEVEKLHTLKETQLDLDQIRWPVTVRRIIRKVTEEEKARERTLIAESSSPLKQVYLVAEEQEVVSALQAVVDRMGRLYFRHSEVEESWFVPGYVIVRSELQKSSRELVSVREQILESTTLYVGDSPACVQVTVNRL